MDEEERDSQGRVVAYIHGGQDPEGKLSPLRKRDFSFEALVDVTGANIAAERGALNQALKQIREASPELDDADLAAVIVMRAEAYRRAYPEIALTPTALAKHWNRVEEQAPTPTYSEPVPGHERCGTCDGGRLVLVGYRPAENPTSPAELGYEQYALCPSCASHIDVSYWRADGTRFQGLDPAQIRELMAG